MLQMDARHAREGRDKSTNHGCKQSQESRVVPIFSHTPLLAKARFVRERTQGVNVREKVIDQKIEGLDWQI
jgi:hypothetical protein